MSDQNTIIAATLKVDAGSANTNIKEVNKNLKDVKSSLKDAGNEAENTGKQIGGAGEHFGKIKEQMNALPGSFDGASAGAGKLNVVFKSLLANPIVALIALIVVALKGLYDAFTSTDEGGQAVQGILDGIGAAFREVTQRAVLFISSITKIFQGDFKGAAEDGRKAITGFGDAMVDAFKRGKEASDLLDEVADSMRVLDLQQAAMNARLAKSKELLTDENASYKDKSKALKESGEVIEKYYKQKADLDEKEITGLAKKYNVEKQIGELRKKGYEVGAKEFDDYLQTLTIGQEGVSAIEESIKKSIQSSADYSAMQRQQNKAENTLNKQQQAEQKAASDKAAAEQKEQRQNLADFNSKLTKLQQDNELALIKDAYEKELKALEIKIANEKAVNEDAFQKKKITREQQQQLNIGLDAQYNLQKDAIDQKHNKETADKEAKFQQEVVELTNKIRLDGITDGRELERVKLEIEHQKELKRAITEYKDDQASFLAQKILIDEDFKKQQEAIDAKNAKEDEKKKMADEFAKNKDILNDPASSFKDKRAALDADVLANQEAFDKKRISEEQYTANAKANSEARKALSKSELDTRLGQAAILANALGGFAELLGKQTAFGKAVSIAQATISTIQGAVSSYTSLASIPIVGPALGSIAAAGAIASGVANVKKIVAVQVPGQGSGGSVPSISNPAPLAPQPKQVSTTINQGSIDRIGQANSSVRAYVVSGDIANDADRNARLQRAANLGG